MRERRGGEGSSQNIGFYPHHTWILWSISEYSRRLHYIAARKEGVDMGRAWIKHENVKVTNYKMWKYTWNETPSAVIKVMLTFSSTVGHSACQGIQHERALSHYYVSPFMHTFVSIFALPTFTFYN